METFTAKQAREIAFKSHEGEYLSVRTEIELAAMRGKMYAVILRDVHPSIISVLENDGYKTEKKRSPNIASGVSTEISW